MRIPYTFNLLIDDLDVDKIQGKKVHLSDAGYPYIILNNVKVKVHNLILPSKEGFEIDHISRDKLDCRNANLRYVTRAENCWNIPVHRDNRTSPYKGVARDTHTGLWRSEISSNGIKIRSPRFHNIKDAAQWYRQKHHEMRGYYPYEIE